MTKALHDARMAFFSLRPKDPPEALDNFCDHRVVPLKTPSGMLITLSLSSILAERKNAAIIENVSKRLPVQMKKYWNIFSKETLELEEILRTKSEPDYRRLARLFKRSTSLKRTRSDPEELRMAKRLLTEKQDPSDRSHICQSKPCAVEEGKRAAAARRTVVRAIVRKAILTYAREKACHEISCHPCFWEDPASCARHARLQLWQTKNTRTLSPLP